MKKSLTINPFPLRRCSGQALTIALLLLLTSMALKAQDSILTVDRIFNSGEFSQGRFGPARWQEDGYVLLEASKETPRARELVLHNPETGTSTVLVTAAQLTPEGAKRPLGVQSYAWSADRSQLLIFTNTRRVWRANTKGDYWVLSLEGNTLKKLGGEEAAEATLMFAKFSPDGNKVAYVREHNVYVEEVSSGVIHQLTRDGSTSMINGTFDWAYEEEFFCRDGFRWSPDGSKIAFWQLDASGVRDFYMINNTDSLYPRLIPVQYPKVGETLSSARLGVVSSTGGDIVWMNVAGAPRDHYLPRMEWAANSDEIVFQQLNRRQNTNKVFLGNVHTGDVTLVMTEEEDTWVDVYNEFYWIKNGEAFLWVSERDGWRHVYEVSRDGEEVKCLTDWPFDVMSLELVDEDGGWLYYIASPDNATERYLYRSKLNGKGKAKRLSPAEQTGHHSYQLAPDGAWAFHTYSNLETPPVKNLISLPNHQVKEVLVTNSGLHEKVNALSRQAVDYFKVTLEDGPTVDGYMIKPPSFDPSKKYPVLIYVYSEPWGQTVKNVWGGSGYLWHLMLAQQGYIVMSLDSRGTPAPRGRTWRKAIYGKIGIVNAGDQAKGLKAALAKFSFLDETRVGIWGWSGGGSSTLSAMFQFPELYHVGMSVAPVGDQRYYDAIYQERYMGLLADNPEGYAQGSPVTHAKNLKGKLLIVHGTGDDNVHYQNAEAVINELIFHNKPFSMMAYPNRSHGIFEGKNTSRHLRHLLTTYLHDHLPAGPR